MLGHEYIREMLRTYLETQIPARLQLHLDAAGLTSPDPERVTVILADTLESAQKWPAVVIRSASAKLDKRLAESTFRYRYEVEVIVACKSRLSGDDDAGSKDRDRLSLATREALLLAYGWPDAVTVAPIGTVEENGVAAVSLPGQPVSAGTLKLTVFAQETVDVAAGSETIDAVDLDVDATDASQHLE